MKIVKRILIGIAALIVLVLVVALFVGKEFSVSREISINKPKQDVFAYVKLLKNQDHYSKWVMTDPNMKKEFRGTDGTEGFVYAWDGNKDAGQGEQELKSIKEGERIDWAIHFKRPMEGEATSYMTTESASADQTKVKWVFNSSMHYPMNVMLLFMDMDKFLGKDLETSLNNLKANLEK